MDDRKVIPFPNGPKSKEDVAELARLKIEEILQQIVEYPEEVQVQVSVGARTTIFKVDCTQRNLGKILGCKGRMITSLRNIALAMTAKHGFRSIIEVPYYVNVNSAANDF